MRRIWMPLAVIVIIILGGLTVWFKLNADNTAPEIIMDEDSMATYYADISSEELLEGVTAEDDRDGDVTDSLVVESVMTSEETNVATVVYVATDSSGNIERVNWNFSLDDGSSMGESEPDEEDDGDSDVAEADDGTGDNAITEDESDNSADDEEADDTAEESTEETSEEELTDEEIAVQERDEAIEALSAEAPRLYLETHYVTLAVGDSFSATGYVDEIEDDSDDRSTLFRRIVVKGEVVTATAGTYEVSYYVTDTSGNKSNVEVLTVTVE